MSPSVALGAVQHGGAGPTCEAICGAVQHRRAVVRRYCLEAHAKAGMIADTDTISEMLLDILPAVFRGESPDALRRPWPTEKAA